MNSTPETLETAVAELTGQRGYREVTALVKPYYEEDFEYLHVFQKPNGEPTYCRTQQDVFTLLNAARTNNKTNETRRAEEPTDANSWTLVGNFDFS